MTRRLFAGLAVVLAAWLALPVTVPAGEHWESLRAGGSARVADVVDGDTVVLDRAIDGARQVRLVGIQAPKLPLGREGFVKWPLADEARDALAGLVLGQRVTLHYGGRRMDRHGRHLAHLRLDDGVWVQGRLLAAGMARVYSFPDNRAAVDAMLALERAARAAGRGIWALSYYAVRTPDEAAGFVGRFELVEGRVLDAATVGGRTYLNFGHDWRRDFTATADRKARRLFAEAGPDPETLAGRIVRVRGWIKSFNGPMIELTHPEQLEVIGDGAP